MHSHQVPVVATPRRRVRSGVALLLGAALLAGAGWSSLAATAGSPTPGEVRAFEAPGPASAPSGRDSYADVVEAVTPAVVTVRVEGRPRATPTAFDDDDLLRRFFGDRFERRAPERQPRAPRRQGLGSGVVVGGDGHILTNHHVIDGAERITVELSDRRTFDAELVGSDAPSDLALLKIEADTLTPIRFGDSDAVRVGDVVLAVGNPLGIGQTVTMGIVSAKGRSTGLGDGGYEDFLQTDAPINRGNSGGALVSTNGELVGINSQIVSTSQGNIGIGFAIPVNMARHVMDALKAEGRVRRARLGVTVQPLTSDMAESLGLRRVAGAIVGSVEPGSAADRAGVQRGDVIRSFDGRTVDDSNMLRNRVAETTPGSEVPLVVVRDGREQTLAVKLDEAPAPGWARGGGGDADEHPTLGVVVVPLTPELADRAGLAKDAPGVWVRQVDPDGRAAAAGIQPNDIIQEVNRTPVRDADDLRAALRAADDRPVLLLVNRGGRDLFVTVRTS
jgi:Do/DeqQ family serine protease